MRRPEQYPDRTATDPRRNTRPGVEAIDVELWPHQIEAVEAVLDRMAEGCRRLFVALPTGTGKTRLAVGLSRLFRRTLFLVPRLELLEQAERAFAEWWGADAVGVLWGNSEETDRPVVVARLERVPRDFDLVVIDEAHHATAPTWRQTVEAFDPALLLGLSATPERMDGAPLSTCSRTWPPSARR